MDDYVDLRFAGGGKFGLGWLMGLVIRQGEMGFPFSHVAFLEKDWTSCIGARAEGGVQRRGVDADAEGATAFLVARIRCSAAQGAAWREHLESRIGQPYDMQAINDEVVSALTGAPPPWADKSAGLICSALQYVAGFAAGVFSGDPLDPRLVNPRDVFFLSLGARAQILPFAT